MSMGGRRRSLRVSVGVLAYGAALLAPAGAFASSHEFLAETESLTMRPTLEVAKGSGTEILDRVVLKGRTPYPAIGHRVTVTITPRHAKPFARRVKADPVTGRFRISLRLRQCCELIAQASDSSGRSDPVRFDVSVPAELGGGRQAMMFNRLLRDNGFHMGEVLTDDYDAATGLAVMALRKTHDLERTESYDPFLFKLLLSGEARFQPEHREDGRHVEVDVGRQVMALVEDGVATDVFHVSTGAGGTPYGQWSFYSKVPGYNAKGMYYSIFYDGNYATHGYSSVPTYPASHGCTRNPPAYSTFIYDWIELGDTMYVYG